MQALVLKPLGDGVEVGGVTEVQNPRRYAILMQQKKIAPYVAMPDTTEPAIAEPIVKKIGRPKKEKGEEDGE